MTPSSPAQAISIHDCRDYLTTHIFQLRPENYAQKYPKWPGMVGIELETLPAALAQALMEPRGVPLQGSERSLAACLRRLSAAQAWECVETPAPDATGSVLSLIKTEEEDNLSFEPGGQLEFSSKPYPCLSDVARRLRYMQTLLDQSLGSEGWHIIQTGINPWHTVETIGLQMLKSRYRAMDAYFERIGPFGRRMMRQTCTVQVCLDFGPSESSLVERFLASQLLAPFAAATFAFSPYVDNKWAGMVGYRSYIWRHLDRSRTGFPELAKIFETRRMSSCVDSYLDFLLDAHVVFVAKLGYLVPQADVSFRTWISAGINGVYPELDDFITHVSLQFPEVRPRGFLELRSVDCQARAWQLVPAALYTGLLYDPKSLSRTLNLLSPYRGELDGLMLDAARGLADSRLRKTAAELMQIAVEGFERLPSCFRGEGTERALRVFAERFTLAGRTPADELIELVQQEGLTRPSLATFQELGNRWLALVR